VAADSGEKTEKPTPRRLREAKKKGQIPRSVDLVQWVSLLAATFVLPWTVGNLSHVIEREFGPLILAGSTGEMSVAMAAFGDLAAGSTLAIAPLFIMIMIWSIVGMVVQGGVVFTGEPLKPKWNRISPKVGFKRIFGVEALAETAKSLIRLGVLGVLISTTLYAATREHLGGNGVDLGVSTELLVEQSILLLRLAAFAGSVVGLADYGFQRWRTTKQLRMSKQEVKQEHRSSEGDPMIRSRRRAAHAKITRNQMLSAVGGARVVVVNPTHFAVALAYSGDGSAPTVVAKGTDELAWRIRERANRHGVPIVDSPPLARALHATVDVGQPIPESFFAAVAIVLAFVMRPRRNRTAATARKVRIPPSKIPLIDA
jgi:flagellar biosynthesis protein FlhB